MNEVEKLIDQQEASWQPESGATLVRQFLTIALILVLFLGLVYMVSRVEDRKTEDRTETPTEGMIY